MTYTPIASQLLSSDTATVTFSSIPNTYRDLVFTVGGRVATGGARMRMRLNNDSAANYAVTFFGALCDNTTASSGSTGYTYFCAEDWGGIAALTPFYYEMHLLDYTQTNKWKSISARGGSRGGGVDGVYNAHSVWQNTSVVNRIDFFLSSGNFKAGSIFSLYGIVA